MTKAATIPDLSTSLATTSRFIETNRPAAKDPKLTDYKSFAERLEREPERETGVRASAEPEAEPPTLDGLVDADREGIKDSSAQATPDHAQQSPADKHDTESSREPGEVTEEETDHASEESPADQSPPLENAPDLDGSMDEATVRVADTSQSAPVDGASSATSNASAPEEASVTSSTGASNERGGDLQRQNANGHQKSTEPNTAEKNRAGEFRGKPESHLDSKSNRTSDGATDRAEPASKTSGSNSSTSRPVDLPIELTNTRASFTTSASSPTPTSATTSHTPIMLAAAPDEPVAPQVARGLFALSATRGGAMNIKLHPEALGAVRVQMSVAQGRVAIQFHAETAEARALLTQSMDTLRQALEGQGLKVDRVSVQALGRNGAANSGTGSGQDGNDGSSREREQANGDRNAGEGRSRGFGDAQDEASRRRQNLRDPRQPERWSTEFRRLHEERSQSEELNHDH